MDAGGRDSFLAGVDMSEAFSGGEKHIGPHPLDVDSDELSDGGRRVTVEIEALEVDVSNVVTAGYGIGRSTLVNVRKQGQGALVDTSNALNDELDRKNGLILATTLMSLSIRCGQVPGTGLTTRRRERRGLGNVGNTAVATGRGDGIKDHCVRGRLALIALVLVSEEINNVRIQGSKARSKGHGVNGNIRLLINRLFADLMTLYGLKVVTHSLQNGLLGRVLSSLFERGMLRGLNAWVELVSRCFFLYKHNFFSQQIASAYDKTFLEHSSSSTFTLSVAFYIAGVY